MAAVSGLHLPPAGEPDPAVAAALEDLRIAREERREASRIIALLVLPGEREREKRIYLTRREIELRTAEYRLGLWSDEVRRLESAVRALGVRP